MSYFKAKMHHIRFRGVPPQTPLGAHSAPQDPLTGFEGVLLLREGNGREGKGRGRKGRKGEGRVGRRGGRGKEEKGEGCIIWLLGGWTPLVAITVNYINKSATIGHANRHR